MTKVMKFSRRQFLAAGTAGSLLLAVSGWLNAAGARRFSGEERDMLAAIVPAILEGTFPDDPAQRRARIQRVVDGLEQTVAGLSLATQKEIGELFGLLVVAPGRWLIAGVSRPWREASVAEVTGFLESWRNSRFALLQGAYAALHDLVFGAWYAQTESWSAIGYPGPPELFK